MLTSLVLLVMGWAVTAWYANDRATRLDAAERELLEMRVKRVADLRAHFELGVHAGRESQERIN